MLRGEKLVWSWVWLSCLATVGATSWGIATLLPELEYPLDRILCATADPAFALPACQRMTDRAEAPAPFRISAHRRLLALAETIGDADTAIRQLDEIIRQKAADPADYNQRGNLHFRAGRYAEAANDYTTGILAGGGHGVLWANLADTQKQLRQYDLAIQNYTTAIRKGERTKDVLFGRGYARLELGHLDSARKDFDAVLELDPRDGYGYAERAVIHERQNHPDLARADYDRAAQFAAEEDDCYDVLFANRGWLHYRQNEAHLARMNFEKSLGKNPVNGDALLGMAWLSVDQEKPDEALGFLNRIPQNDPISSQQYEARSLAELKLDHWALALAAADRAIETGSSPWPYSYRGQARFYLRDFAGAYSDFSTVLTMRPDHLDTLDWRAYASIGKGSLADAMADAETVIRLGTKIPYGYRTKSFIASEGGDHATAVAAARMAVSLDPDRDSLLVNLAYRLLDAGHYPAALATCEAALAPGSMEEDEYTCRGLVRMALGQIAAALGDAEQSISINPGRSAAYLLRGRLKLKLNDNAGALADLNEGIELSTFRRAEYFLYRGDAYRALGKEDRARSDYEYARRIDFGPFVPEIESRLNTMVHKQKAGTDGPL